MQIKTGGIVLHQFKYTDTSIIATIYTRTNGRLAFLLQGIRKKGTKMKANLFQPLFLVDLEIYYKSKRQLQKIKEANNNFPFQSIPYDYKKRAIALFLGEILYKTLQEEESNPYLFDFIYNHIKILDLKEKGLSNFHIYFLLQLTKHLGFFPQMNYNQNQPIFDLKKGNFVQIRPNHEDYLDQESSSYFHELLNYSKNQHEELKVPKKIREQLMDNTLKFYYMHNPGMTQIKSFDILKETFE
jgi:DNA repair protein RecO (recombination protein O)